MEYVGDMAEAYQDFPKSFTQVEGFTVCSLTNLVSHVLQDDEVTMTKAGINQGRLGEGKKVEGRTAVEGMKPEVMRWDTCHELARRENNYKLRMTIMTL
jgi:hypothetical protein